MKDITNEMKNMSHCGFFNKYTHKLFQFPEYIKQL